MPDQSTRPAVASVQGPETYGSTGASRTARTCTVPSAARAAVIDIVRAHGACSPNVVRTAGPGSDRLSSTSRVTARTDTVNGATQ